MIIRENLNIEYFAQFSLAPLGGTSAFGRNKDRRGAGEANGYYVSLAHGSGYTSICCHMTKYIVSVGDSVSQGQVIGYVGSTGWSTGPHLHFELHQNGTALNPAEYLPLS